MYSTHVIVTLLIISIVLLVSVVSFLLFNVENEDSFRETTREETFVDATPTPPEPVATTTDSTVSQEPQGTERALGTDHGMEFPTLDE